MMMLTMISTLCLFTFIVLNTLNRRIIIIVIWKKWQTKIAMTDVKICVYTISLQLRLVHELSGQLASEMYFCFIEMMYERLGNCTIYVHKFEKFSHGRGHPSHTLPVSVFRRPNVDGPATRLSNLRVIMVLCLNFWTNLKYWYTLFEIMET